MGIIQAMNKKAVRMGVWFVLIALGVWIFAESQREPDHVAAAMEHVPEGCNVLGAWRDMTWPEESKEFRPTYVLCDDASNQRHAITVLEGSPQHAAVQKLDENYSTEGSLMGGDVFTINADGSLTISDELGEIKTLPSH